ncbi:hypothetical protein [Avibacterium paragallinarum]|uniref:hypothetical protein n=1 Tax=Avibacterium paragallinarum TaxID=728 RepID=UPI002162871A|nr:hypothetical protein [Avibacterium paragallinarum]
MCDQLSAEQSRKKREKMAKVERTETRKRMTALKEKNKTHISSLLKHKCGE